MKKIFILFILSQSFISGYSQNAAQSEQFNYTHFTGRRAKITGELEALTSKEFKTHPEYGTVPFNAPCEDCFEVLQKRDENHRYFVKEGSNGHKFYAQTSYSNLNYYDAKGRLLTIDYRLKPTSQQGVYSASNQPLPVTVNVHDKYVSLLNAGKELQVSRNVSLYIKKSDGSLVSMGEASWADYTAGDDGVMVHNIYPGIDLELKVGEGKVESFYHINKPLNLQGASLVIRDNMKLPADLSYDFSYSEKKTDNLYKGALCINNSKGSRYYIISSPAAIDENAINTKDYEIGLEYGIDPNGSYDLYMPISWMNDPKRSYPIVIDPLVIATSLVPKPSITGSGYNANCFAGGCSYPLYVKIPGAVSISNLIEGFTYVASGACNQNQGAYDITYNTCRSPDTVGSWHTCPTGTPGQCTINVSLFKDMQSCLPASKCSDDSMLMTLTFYRCVDTTSGCGPSCINAGSVWEVTVVGNIIAVSALDTSICTPASIVLTANADSGLAPYTYKWYPGGSTNSSITVSPATTTTYTVTAYDCAGADSIQAFPTVTIGQIAAVAGPDTTICGGSSVQLNASGGTSYTWLPATGLSSSTISNPTATDTVTTTYTVTATTGSCQGTGTVTITVIPVSSGSKPSIQIIPVQPDTSPPYTIVVGDGITFNVKITGMPNDTVHLTASSPLLNGGYNASLSLPDSGLDSLTRTFTYVSTCADINGSPYHLTFTGSSGRNSICSSLADTSITVDISVVSPSTGLLDTIPNIFTPNGDLKNDSLTLYHVTAEKLQCWTNFHVQIFNRWGELLYEDTNINFHWGGTNKSGNKVPEGVYFYVITGDFQGKAVTKKGTVNVKM